MLLPRFRVSAGTYLSNSALIDSERLISVGTRAHKFSFVPLGEECCGYHSMDNWTFVLHAEINKLAKQIWLSITTKDDQYVIDGIQLVVCEWTSNRMCKRKE